MKTLINNKALRYINFRLIPDRESNSKQGFNRSKSYIYMIYKKTKRYTLKDNNTLIIVDPHDLFIWPYKNLAIHAKKFWIEIV